MKKFVKGEKLFIIGLALAVIWVHAEERASALLLKPQNIQAMAVYGPNSDYGTGLNQATLNFNITDPAVIANLISSIEFSIERDCSRIGGESGAYLYIKYSDGGIEVYDLFDSFTHFSKVGLNGSCYFISETGQNLFESLAQ